MLEQNEDKKEFNNPSNNYEYNYMKEQELKREMKQEEQNKEHDDNTVPKDTKKQNIISLDNNAHMLIKKLKERYKSNKGRNYTYSDTLRELLVSRKKYVDKDKMTDEMISKINRELDLLYADINIIKGKIKLIINERR